jgi:hypothetical protein
MTIKGTEKLLLLLRTHGVSHFKTPSIEIRIGASPAPDSVAAVGPVPFQASTTKAPPPQAAPPVEMQIPHHVNEVANLLKLNDDQLVDKLFPDHTAAAE